MTKWNKEHKEAYKQEWAEEEQHKFVNDVSMTITLEAKHANFLFSESRNQNKVVVAYLRELIEKEMEYKSSKASVSLPSGFKKAHGEKS